MVELAGPSLGWGEGTGTAHIERSAAEWCHAGAPATGHTALVSPALVSATAAGAAFHVQMLLSLGAMPRYYGLVGLTPPPLLLMLALQEL